MKLFNVILTTLFITTPLISHAHPPASCELADTKAIVGPFSTAIELSEVYPAPDGEEEEFIELYNSNGTSVDLSGWMLADASGKKYVIDAEDFVSTSIPGHGYLVIPYSVSKIYLNNSSDSVLLYQPDEVLLDETAYEGGAKGQSWSKLKKAWAWTTTATEGAANKEGVKEEEEKGIVKDAKQETSTQILLSELLPNPAGPDGTDEWIEIENTGNTSVYLGGWQLTDGSRYYTIGDLSIQRGEFLLFEVGETKINLNNTGDTVYLIDPFGEIIHGTTYADSTEGESWSRLDGEWEWTTEITPTAPNQKTVTENPGEEDDPEEEKAGVISIAQLRTLTDGESGTIEGVVTVLPSIFGTQYFYIQDDSAGIQIYSYRKDYPDLEVGDLVRVTGEKATTHEETRLKTSTQEDIQVLSSGNEVEIIGVVEIEETLEGMLVEIEGEVTEQSGTKATINDLILVSLKTGANIDKSKLEEGTVVKLRGIVIQSSAEYQLLPRNNDDISAVQTDEVPFINGASASGFTAPPLATSEETQNDQTMTLLIILIAGLAAAVVGMVLKQKKTGTKKQNAEQNNISQKMKTQSTSIATIFDAAQKVKKEDAPSERLVL